MFCVCPDFPRAFFLTIVVQNVVQVPWLPQIAEGHVNPKGFRWVGACATGTKMDKKLNEQKTFHFPVLKK
jgi:hypothetical protein